MTFFFKRISVLLLMAVITCDTKFDEGLTIPEHCQDDVTVKCAQELLNQIENKTSQELPQESVENYLNIMMNITSLVKENTTDQDLILYGNDVLDFTEELVSKLVKETDDIQSISIPLQSLEVQVIELELNSSVSKIPSLTTTTASMDIQVTGIPNKSNVAVVLMSFTNMAAILHASFFNAFVYTTKTIISPVVSAKLLQVSGFTTIFSKVNFTLKHVDELDPKGFLSCVYWNRKEWVEDGCNIRRINRTHTLCSCDHLGTFATIQKTFDVTYVYYLNLSRVSSNQGEGLSCKWFILIGYLIPLVLVVMRGIVSHGICKHSNCSVYMFIIDVFAYIPFFIISALILILHIISIIIIILNLIRLKNQNLLRTNSNDTKLIMSVLFKSLAQFFIFGCPWLAYFFVTGDVFFTVNLICIQQGVFIFLFHCLLNPEVRQQYRKFLCAICSFNNCSPAAADDVNVHRLITVSHVTIRDEIPG
ncbi:adhesion G protein-coupled receptor E3-like isoform X3 [Silurus meridionalis]|uniref:adhesion G protein-coupled receptor E3-like isoform X3 n=1 Tax=Silurus meridionalis TaxID=175797 RepID=UPI001EEB84A5|nr:adhesion G protein-coupled receptor E3-like isoform X3 [Silurus meridionalis]